MLQREIVSERPYLGFARTVQLQLQQLNDIESSRAVKKKNIEMLIETSNLWSAQSKWLYQTFYFLQN